jgi:hypothetical protein
VVSEKMVLIQIGIPNEDVGNEGNEDVGNEGKQGGFD